MWTAKAAEKNGKWIAEQLGEIELPESLTDKTFDSKDAANEAINAAYIEQLKLSITIYARARLDAALKIQNLKIALQEAKEQEKTATDNYRNAILRLDEAEEKAKK